MMETGRRNEFKTRLNRIQDAAPPVARPGGGLRSVLMSLILIGPGCLLAVCLLSTCLQNLMGQPREGRDRISSERRLPSLLSISNINNGETLRYPVALICGTTDDLGDIHVFNANNAHPDGQNSVPITNGRFKILVELVAGTNQIKLTTASVSTSLTLNYKPMTTPYKVVFAYLVPDEGKTDKASLPWTDRENANENLSTAAKLLQTFMAERMNDAGFGRKTFNLEYDAEGKVLIHTFAYPGSQEDLKSAVKQGLGTVLERMHEDVERRFSSDRNQVVLFTSFINQKFRGMARGSLALVGYDQISRWPRSIQEVRASETNGAAAYQLGNIGPVLHELGHCFGCNHTTAKYSIMQQNWTPEDTILDGPYDFNRLFTVTEPASKTSLAECAFMDNQIPGWEPFLACHLYYHRWLQPDAREYLSNRPITIRWERSTQEIMVKAPYGIGAIQFYGPPTTCQEHAPPSKSQYEFFEKDPPKTRRYKLSRLHAVLETKGQLHVSVTDTQGNVRTYDESEE